MYLFGIEHNRQGLRKDYVHFILYAVTKTILYININSVPKHFYEFNATRLGHTLTLCKTVTDDVDCVYAFKYMQQNRNT